MPQPHRLSAPGRQVRGHALHRIPSASGKPSRPARFTDDGWPILRRRRGEPGGRGMCQCGAMSEPGLTDHQVHSWHRDHRRGLLGLE